MTDDELSWKTAVYEQAIGDGQIEMMAWQIVEASSIEDDPPVTAADMACALRYLKTCMLRMTVNELSAASSRTIAGLMARGALGARDYRLRRSPARAPALSGTPRKRKLRKG